MTSQQTKSRRPVQADEVETITTTARLDEVCAALAREPAITVDTEFLRDSTYWSLLCLVQVAGAEAVYVIDPLARGIELSSLYRLMNDERVVKVFHAARQDVEIFLQASGETPRPIFDTQIAAMACGFGESVSYADLARSLLGVQVDKSQRVTDWSRRPLAPSQTLYAAREVDYLRSIHRMLAEKLEKTGRAEWVRAEMKALVDPRPYQDSRDPEQAWKRLKRPPRSAQAAWDALRVLAAWREREAQSRNVPRSRIIRDEALYEIAAHPPKETRDLANLRMTHGGFHRSSAAERLVACLAKAQPLSDETQRAQPVARGARAASATRDMLRLTLKAAGEGHGVATLLIASAGDLDALAAGERDLPCLRGWRHKVFGVNALALLEGRASLGLDAKGVKVVVRLHDPVPDSPVSDSDDGGA